MRNIKITGRLVMILIAFICVAVNFILAQDQDSKLEAKIKELIQKLDSDKFDDREKATEELIKIGKPAVPLLEKALKETDDPEVKFRAEYIIEEITTFWIVFKKNGNIYKIKSSGKAETQLTHSRVNYDYYPKLSPDGKKIVFVSVLGGKPGRGNPEIYIMNTDGSDQKRLTNYIGEDWHPSFSPDAKKIVFESDRDGYYEIYIMNADGSDLKRLTKNKAYDGHPSFSPDGKKIVFVSTRDSNREIYIMNADGSNQKRLTKNKAIDHFPLFSPDGKKIVFASNRDGNFEIYIMNADGSEQKRLTKNNARDEQPSFSPDGKKIIFYRGGALWIMDIDGSNQKKITEW